MSSVLSKSWSGGGCLSPLLVFPFKMTQRDGKVNRIYFRNIGFTTQILTYVAEVELVDTSDCHSEDSGFEPRRSRQPDIDAFFCNRRIPDSVYKLVVRQGNVDRRNSLPIWAHSSNGRAPALQAGCCRFESDWVHQQERLDSSIISRVVER